MFCHLIYITIYSNIFVSLFFASFRWPCHQSYIQVCLPSSIFLSTRCVSFWQLFRTCRVHNVSKMWLILLAYKLHLKTKTEPMRFSGSIIYICVQKACNILQTRADWSNTKSYKNIISKEICIYMYMCTLCCQTY